MKKIINDPTTVVDEALDGVAAAHGDLLTLHRNPTYVTRADGPIAGKVALVSGGGAGHEPLHVGYVGVGMLDAAVPGAIFTSPTPDQILDATKAVDGGAGVLHIVKNYTGDVLNFEMAAELAAAEGIEVSAVVVDDDVAVKDSTWTAGRRGVGGTVLLEKIAGAAAARGDDLAGVTAIATRVNSQVRSMGMALRACTVPHSGEPSFSLAEDEMEIGIGIHGEPGRETRKLAPADEIVAILLDAIVEDLPFDSGARTLLFVNGMGGTPEVELYLAYNSARKYLADKGIGVERSLVGNYITALEMQGMSITLLALDDELVELWDAPVHTVALRRDCDLMSYDAQSLVKAIAALGAEIAQRRTELTHLDQEIGDGDHGENLARGFSAVLTKLRAGAPETPGKVLSLVATTLISTVGGASGPLFGTAFLRASTTLGTATEIDGPAVAACLGAARDGVAARGKAEVGDKTMIDALAPAADAAAAAAGAGADVPAVLTAAADAAAAGAAATAPLQARKGRASYLGERSIGHVDPGAQSTAYLLASLADSAQASAERAASGESAER